MVHVPNLDFGVERAGEEEVGGLGQETDYLNGFRVASPGVD